MFLIDMMYEVSSTCSRIKHYLSYSHNTVKLPGERDSPMVLLPRTAGGGRGTDDVFHWKNLTQTLNL